MLTDNPFVDFGGGAILTPRIAGLAGGAEAFGLLTLDAATLLGDDVFDEAPDGAGLAVIRVDTGIAGLVDNYLGYDLVLVANISGAAFDTPTLRIGSVGERAAFRTGGTAADPVFGDGSDDPMTSFAAGAIYALLIPEAAQQFSILATREVDGVDVDFSASVEELNNGEVLYVREPGLTVMLNQRIAPDDVQFAGRSWESLGIVTVTPDTTTPESPAIEVVITDASGGIVAADGVILRRVDTSLPGLRLITLSDNPLDQRSHDIFIEVLESRASTLGLTAVNPGPVDGDFVNDLTLKFTVGLNDGTLLSGTVELSAIQSQANSDLAGLAAQLNTLLADALDDLGLEDDAIVLQVVGERLSFDVTDTDIASLRVEGAEQLGFAAGQGVGPDVEFTPNEAPEIAQIANQPGTPNAFTFNGTSSRITVANSASLQADGELTIEAWINPTGPGQDGIIVNKEGEYEVARFSDGTIRWAFANSNPGWVWINTGYVAKLNEWTHIAVVYDNGDVRTYADGELVHFFDGAGEIGDVHTGQNTLQIGDRESFTQHFQGQIDEVRVWTAVRSQTEIRDAMNRILDGDEAGLAGYWTFDDQTTSTAFGSVVDYSGNGNHGTPSGGAVRSHGPIRIEVRDQLGDPIYLHVVSDTPQVQAEMLDESNLLITEAPGFEGTVVITLTAFDGLGAAGDPHGRHHTVTFEYTSGGNSAQAIYGTKFNDIDGDGVRDPNEPGIDGVKLFLDLNANGLLDEREPVTYTDVNGEYGFRGLEVVDPVPHGPAELVAAAPAEFHGGATQTIATTTAQTEIVDRTEATFQFTAQSLPDALSFDGGDRVTVAHNASTALAGSSTVEVRFRYDFDATNQFRALVHKTSASPLFRTYSMFINQNTGTLFFDTWDAQSGQQSWFLSNVVLQPGQWYEFATVIDRDSTDPDDPSRGPVKAYLNGTEVLSSTVLKTPAAVTTNPLLIGDTLETNFAGFDGIIDNVAIWNKPRTQDEIKADFADGIAAPAVGLAGYWQFDESGGVAIDSSGNANHGTLGTGVEAPLRVDAGTLEPVPPGFSTTVILTPEQTSDNLTGADLRDDFNLAFALQKVSHLLSAHFEDGVLFFQLAGGFDAFQVAASTHQTVIETLERAGAPIINTRLDEVTGGAFGFAAFSEDQTPGSLGELGVAQTDITADVGLKQIVAAGEATIETETTRTTEFLLSVDGLTGYFQLMHDKTLDNDDIFDLAADLEALVNGDPVVGPLVTVGVADGRLKFTTTGVGDTRTVQLHFSDTFGQSVTTTAFGNGAEHVEMFQLPIGPDPLGFGGSGFAQGTNRSYLVAEVPFPGWTPTTGATSTPAGVIGVLPVLFTDAGQIVEGVDFGNQLIADFDLGEDFEVDEGDEVSFMPTVVGSPGAVFTYLWEVQADNGQIIADGDEATFSFVPFDNGTYTVQLTVTDTFRGLTSHPDTVIVTSLNVAPEVEAGTAQTVFEGEIVSIEPAFDDAGTNDTHTAVIAWGDGTTTIFESLTETNGAGTIPATHVYADDGVYTVMVSVTDDDGATTSDTLVVTVDNVAPVVDAGPDRTADEGALVSLSPLIVIGDNVVIGEDVPLPPTVRFTDSGTLDTHSATIDWGDGTAAETGLVSEVPFGPPGSEFGLTGLVLGSHVYADDGVYTVIVTVTDDNGGEHSDSFDITITNVAPVIRPTAHAGREGELISLKDVTFLDPGTLDTHTGTVNWGDGTATEDLVIASAPFGPPGSLGGLTGTLNGSHVYADDGEYIVTFVLHDDDGGIATETLTMIVDVVNDPPTVEAGTGTTIFEGDEFSLSGASFNDKGTLDTHTASVNWGDGTTSAGTVTETPFGPPGSTAGMSGTAAASHFYGDDSGAGQFTVTLTVTDDDDESGADTVLVKVLNVAPEVTAGADVEAFEGDTVMVSATFTDPGFLDTHTAEIDWGDGMVTMGAVDAATKTVTGAHVYADNGPYLVTLTVTDDDGGEDSDGLFVTINNAPPVVTDGAAIVDEGVPLALLIPFTDPGSGDTHTALVDFGDGTLPVLFPNVTGSVSVSHTYADNGDFTVTIAVTDDEGATGTGTWEVTVNNVAPIAVGDGYEVNEDNVLVVPAAGVLGNDSDVPADTLSAVLISGPANGTLTLNADGSFSYTPALDFNGSDSFTYSAHDEDGGASLSATVEILVHSVNDAPTVVLGPNLLVDEDDGAQEFAGWASAFLAGPADEAGQTLTLEISNDFEDLFSEQPTLGFDGTLRFTPGADAFGTALVTVALSDNGGTERGGVDTSMQTFTITVAPINDRPLATSADFGIDEDTPLSAQLAGFDADGDALTFAQFGPGPVHGTLLLNPDGSFTYTPHANYFTPDADPFGGDTFGFRVSDGIISSLPAVVKIQVAPVNDAPVANGESYDLVEDEPLDLTPFGPGLGVLANDVDVDGDTLAAILVDGPDHGSLVLLANGVFVYTPAADFFGPDSFTYQARDPSNELSNVATVSLTVQNVNDAPVAGNANVVVDEDDVLEDTLLPLTDPDAGEEFTFTILDAPDHGVLVTHPDGSFSYTPAPNFFGADSFTFRANDGELDSNVGTVSITVNPVNDAPVLDAIDDTSVDEGTPLLVTAHATDVDGPADLPVYSLDVAPEGAEINPATGLITWTPSEVQGPGSHSFVVRATDSSSPDLFDTEQFMVTVNEVNRAPVIDAVPDFGGDEAIDELTLFTVDVNATDPDVPANTLSYSFDQAPEGAEIDPLSGVITWTPGETQDGEHLFVVRATDNGTPSMSDTEEFSVTVNEVNLPPVLNAIGDRTVSEGELLTFTVGATDPDVPANTLAFTATGLPAGATFDPATGVFSWMPSEAQGPATYNGITFEVADLKGLFDSETISITVLEDASLDAGPQADDGNADDFRVVRNGANVEGYLNDLLVFNRSAASLAGFPLTVTGSGDDDTLTVDFSGGDPIPPLGLAYAGGDSDRPDENDELVLTGTSPSSVVQFEASGPSSGTVTVDGSTITYTGLEPITLSAAAALEFGFQNGDDVITLTIGETTSTLSSPSSETITFVNPADSVTILARGGDDTIVVVNNAAGDPDFEIVIDGGSGANTVTSDVPVQTALAGTDGDDVIGIAQTGADIVVTVNGATTTLENAASVRVDGRAGDDVIDASDVHSIAVVLLGGEGNDQLTGGSANDTLLGGPGDDVLAGRGGVDVVDGGEGNDTAVVQRVTPIAYWSLNETSGSGAADSAGTPQNGTFFGSNPDHDDAGPPLSAAPFGAQTGADFHDTTREYIAVQHSAEFEVPQGTVQLWFKTRDADDRQALFAKDRDGNGAGHLLIWIDDHDLKVRLQTGTTSHTITANNVVSSNVWYQMTFTFGPAGMKLYLNGTQVGTNAYTGGLTANQQPIVIGGSNATHRNGTSDLSRLRITDPFDGWIDEVAFYGAALSPAEIAQTKAKGAMAVTAPADANDTFVSIENTVFADDPHAGDAAASTLQGTVFTDTALTNVATFFGLNGRVDVGTFDGRAPCEPRAGSGGWASVLKQGVDFIKQKLHSASDERGDAKQESKQAKDDWVVVAKSEAKAKDAIEKDRKGDAKIDWKGALASLGAPLFSRGGGHSRPAQPNIAEFNHQPGKVKR
ncbi:MAG TPA: tandem-95 repeat protein [Steroidobacteraceae bacterium]|nr:tandem-95 repeat protein [Steroidobacteraceae bacterium]